MAHEGVNVGVKVIYPIDLDENGNEREDKRHKELDIPMSEDNANYQEILEWVAEGNTIEEAD